MPDRSPAARSLHRLRSALARVRGELDLLELDGHPVAEALAAVDHAVHALAEAEYAVEPPASAFVSPHPAAADVQVVLLEDEDRLAQLTARRLKRAGLGVATAASLVEALAATAAGAVLVADLGALDVQADGDLTARVRAIRPIIVSGGAGAAARRAAAAFQAHAFFLKPVDPGALVVAISERLAEAAR